MVFLVNGTPLDNPDLGWTVQKGTIPVAAVQLESTSSSQAGRDGIVPGPSTRKPGTMRFVVASSTATRGDLLALFTAPQLVITDSTFPGRTATGKLLSSSPVTYLGYDDWGEDLFVVEIHEGCWRGELVTTELIASAPGGAEATVFPGLSVPVQDAVVRMTGPLQNPQLLDSSGAFLAVDGSLSAGQYLRFDSNTGRAWTTLTDTWDGGEEVSGLIDFGGPRGVFELTPRVSDPVPEVVARNYAPSLYGETVPVEVRRNLAVNPRMEAAGGLIPQSNNSATLPITRAVDVPVPHPLGFTKATEGRYISGGVAWRTLSVYNLDRSNVGAPERMIGCWVLSNEPGYQVRSGNGFVPIPLPANEWVFIATVTPVPAETLSTLSLEPVVAGAPSSTARGYVTGVISKAGTVPVTAEDYFDGSTSPDPDMTARWLGAANASASVLEGQHPVSFTDSKVISIVTADGAKLRQIPTEPAGAAGGADAFTRVDVAASVLQAAFTVAATLTLPAPLSVGIESRGRRIVAYSPEISTAAAQNTAGTYPLRLEAPARTSTYQVRLYHGGRAGSGDAYWSQIGIYPGDYQGPHFDERTIPADGHTYVQGAGYVEKIYTPPVDVRLRDAKLTLAQDSYSVGAGFQIRGRAAYLT